MKRISFIVVVLVMFFLSVQPVSVRAGNIPNGSQIFLPIILNNHPSGPEWVKNPAYLPPANGWPGWTGDSHSFPVNCQRDVCFATAKVDTPPEYLVIEGNIAIYPNPDLSLMGGAGRCYAIVIAETYDFGNQDIIVMPNGATLTFYWMSVPNPDMAPPLQWAAQAKEDVMQNYPGCINPDIALYYTP
jgi:hypothetical protein